MVNQDTNNSRQAAWVAVGSFFSFIVGIVSPMILSRFLDKSDYGTYKQVMYIYTTLLTVFTLGLPKAYAYFLPKYSIEYSKDIISKITKIFFILGSIFSLFLLVFAGPISILMNNTDLKGALLLFSPTPLLLLPTLGLDAIYASFRKTKYLAFYTIFTRILTVFSTVLPVVIFKGNYVHAIIGFDIASLITCMLAIYFKSWPVAEVPKHKSDLTYRKIFNFSLPLLYASLWGMIIASSNQFFISRYFGNEVFADFSNGFMDLPFVGMILGSISAILLPVFSGMTTESSVDKDCFFVWKSALYKSAKLIFPMQIFCIFFAQLMMTCMYGDIYVGSSVYFQIKCFSGLFTIIPFYPIILAIGKTKEYANVHLLMACVLVVSEYAVCKTIHSPVCIAIVSEFFHLVKIYLVMHIVASFVQKNLAELLYPKYMIKILSVSIISGVATYLSVYTLEFDKFILLIISSIIFILFYLVLCWIFKISYQDILGGLMGKNSRLQVLFRIIP